MKIRFNPTITLAPITIFNCTDTFFRVKNISSIIVLIYSLLFCFGNALAATCDQYPGDLWAYTASIKPNVLIIIDTSSSMNETIDGVKKIDIARNVVKKLITDTKGVNFGLMVFNEISDTSSRYNRSDSRKNSEGARFLQSNVDFRTYVTTVKDMDLIHNKTTSNRAALIAAINDTTVKAGGWTPLAESLLEAGQYFSGGPSKFENTIGLQNSKYVSPITATCQRNIIVFITDGMSTSDDHADLAKEICPSSNKNCNGDYDGDKKEPSPPIRSGIVDTTNMWHTVDDAAAYLYDKLAISTYMVGFGEEGSNATFAELLTQTADEKHGRGAAYLPKDEAALADSLGNIFSAILSIDSSFVTPVVSTNPEAVAKDGSRLYLGFFKTVNRSNWEGNLKKFGLDVNNNIIDKNGNPATLSDGSFKADSTSYWSSPNDGFDVKKGGAGERLQNSIPANRSIYTYTGSKGDLTDVTNGFKKDNDNLTAAKLRVAETEKDKLVEFIRGAVVSPDGSNTKRPWLFGDILHSRPQVIRYGIFSPSDESNCDKNKNVIYVGVNDGMLHAINDCDGSERWAFIPPDLLSNLKDIAGPVHTYGVDASPVVYQYDANKNGVIDTGDKAIMLLGTRRGGGSNSAPATGSYHLLDITNPSKPQYIWNISSRVDGDFNELAESWAEPRITTMKIGTDIKVVAFLPGGYDNLNEDSRYGVTQTFKSPAAVINTDSGGGSVTSVGNFDPPTPKGRGLYAVEIATLKDGVPKIASAPNRIWGVVPGKPTDYESSPAIDSLSHSLTADVAVLDVNGDGYTDRVYAADVGGGLWRFDVGSSTVSNWRGNKIFKAPSGRKIFYKPAVTLELTATNPNRGLDAIIFMGTGDREHPLNTAVENRLYAVRDRGQVEAKGEDNLVDLTDDELQSPDGSKVNAILAMLKDVTKFGWYIRLNQNPGEKALALPTVFNRVAYFTTYIPSLLSNPNPCEPNIGTSRLYAVNYATGEAVFNFDKINDNTPVTNKRAEQGDSKLLRADRFLELGTGIASGVAIKGDTLLVSAGGKIIKAKIGSGKRFIPLYWGQK